MRQEHFTRIALAILLCGSPLWLAACGDDDNGDEDTSTDTGSDTTEDTSTDTGTDTGTDTETDTFTDVPTDDVGPTCPPAGYTGLSCSEIGGDCVCILSGTYTEDMTLIPEVKWILRGGVFIGDDENETVLTIEPGTYIYGETSTEGMLVVTRHSRIMAEGTEDAPIVFTSSQNPGARARGDWGGLIINGLAPVNGCETPPCSSFGEGGTGWYGGDDPHDDSGTLRYVRVEFAGIIISPDNELNGIALQGVGDGTTLDYLQVHMNKDDGIEFFGGTARASHVLITGVDDDNLDWTDGWTGMVQFLVAQQYEDGGDNGIEADNNGEDNTSAPRSHPTISNVTLIGSPSSTFSDLGMLLREGTAANISCAVVVGWNDACFDIDNDETYLDAWNAGTSALSGELTVTDSVLSCTTTYKSNGSHDPATPPFTLQDFIETLNAGNQLADPLLGAPYDLTDPDYVPGTGSPALAGCNTPADAFFDDVAFKGGVDPTDDWTAGWTIHELN